MPRYRARSDRTFRKIFETSEFCHILVSHEHFDGDDISTFCIIHAVKFISIPMVSHINAADKNLVDLFSSLATEQHFDFFHIFRNTKDIFRGCFRWSDFFQNVVVSHMADIHGQDISVPGRLSCFITPTGQPAARGSLIVQNFTAASCMIMCIPCSSVVLVISPIMTYYSFEMCLLYYKMYIIFKKWFWMYITIHRMVNNE